MGFKEKIRSTQPTPKVGTSTVISDELQSNEEWGRKNE